MTVASRVCERDGCDTVLSSYNASDYCAIHERERATAWAAAAPPPPPPPAPPEEEAEPQENDGTPPLLHPDDVDADAVDVAVLDLIGKSDGGVLKRDVWGAVPDNLKSGVVDAIARLRADGRVVTSGKTSATRLHLAERAAKESSPPPNPEPSGPEPDAGPEIGGPSQERTDDWRDSPGDNNDYAQMVALLRDVYAHGYDRYLSALIGHFEDCHEIWVADRIEKMLDSMVGWCE